MCFVRRSRSIQTTAAAVALVFLGALGAETFGAHSCPRHHQGSPGAPTASAGVTSPSDAPHGSGGPHFCTCVGICHGGAASPLPTDGLASAVLPLEPAAVERARVDRERPRVRDAYFLPYPNGPPLS